MSLTSIPRIEQHAICSTIEATDVIMISMISF